ncbi:MAG: hypothetical protein ACFFAS_07185 [Promethearchaeota archaeon]
MKIPQSLFVEITSACNLRCQLCRSWQNSNSSSVLILGEKLAFINAMIGLLKRSKNQSNELSTVILTGGGPFLYPDGVFTLSESYNLK